MHSLRQDLKLAVRTLAKTKIFTITAVLMLALGLAMNTLVFSMVSAVLLQNLPYPKADQLTVLHWRDQHHRVRSDVSAAAYFFIAEKAQSFKSVSVIYPLDSGANISGGVTPQYSRILRVSHTFFQTLGVSPYRGRDFLPEEDRVGANHTAIVSYAFWKQNLGGGPFSGGQIQINGQPYTIVGIMPSGFHSYPDAEIWAPLQLSSATADPGSDYRVIARLKPAISQAQAEQELGNLSRQFPLPYIQGHDQKGELTLESFHDLVVGKARTSLRILFGAVVFVLLVACTNVGMLLLVRAISRGHESAVRAALGSSKLRLLQVPLAEAAVLAALGTVIGLVIAKELLPFLLKVLPGNLALHEAVEINGPVLWFILALFTLTVFGLGLIPAGRISHRNLHERLQQSPRQVSQSAEQNRAGQVMISCQIALTIVLLAGAISLLKSFVDLRSTAPGFDPRGVISAEFSLANPQYWSGSASTKVIQTSLTTLRTLPDVQSAAAVVGLPLQKSLNLPVLSTRSPEKLEHACDYIIASPGYFSTMGIAQITGREFSESDTSSSTPVAIVNETLARHWWPDGNATGQFVQTGMELGAQFADKPRMVIGVVADVRDSGLDRAPTPTVYVPFTQVPDQISEFVNKTFLTSVVVKLRRESRMGAEIQKAIRSADPELSPASVQPIEEVLSKSLAGTKFYTTLISGFALVAFALTAIGLVGLMGYQMRLRNREIAIRIAFGAKPSEIFILFLKQGMKLVGSGLLAGIIFAFPVIRFLESVVERPRGTSAGVLLQAFLPLALLALMTTLFTSARASATEPTVVLRTE